MSWHPPGGQFLCKDWAFQGPNLYFIRIIICMTEKHPGQARCQKFATPPAFCRSGAGITCKTNVELNDRNVNCRRYRRAPFQETPDAFKLDGSSPWRQLRQMLRRLRKSARKGFGSRIRAANSLMTRRRDAFRRCARQWLWPASRTGPSGRHRRLTREDQPQFHAVSPHRPGRRFRLHFPSPVTGDSRPRQKPSAAIRQDTIPNLIKLSQNTAERPAITNCRNIDCPYHRPAP